MPSRLRPTNTVHTDAILVGDPGRALLLAQELLAEPKMSNHARGLWGYSGTTASGHDLTIQSTGMGGPSAAIVLADLTKLGLLRAVRVGTCSGLEPSLKAGDTIAVREVIGRDGTSRALAGGAEAPRFRPSPVLFAALSRDRGIDETDGASGAGVTLSTDIDSASVGGGKLGGSIDFIDLTQPSAFLGGAESGERESPVAADLQTASLFALGQAVGIEVAALLIIERDHEGHALEAEELAELVKIAGSDAAAALVAQKEEAQPSAEP